MRKEFKFFLFVFALSLPFWWGMNIFGAKLENFLFSYEMNKNNQIFAAQMYSEDLIRNLRPTRISNAENLEITARSAISFLVKRIWKTENWRNFHGKRFVIYFTYRIK